MTRETGRIRSTYEPFLARDPGRVRPWILSLGKIPRRSNRLRVDFLHLVLLASSCKTAVGSASTPGRWRVAQFVFFFLAFPLLVSCGGDNPMQPPPEPRDPVQDDRAALVALYNATDGQNWTRSTNWLSGRPLGEWHGVTTDATGRVTHLEFVTLDEHGRIVGNGLSGSLPPQLGDLISLQVLLLDRNSLSGDIPSELGNLSHLHSLSLSFNSLSGDIPSELGNLSNLWSLDLFHNSLSGGIPSILGNLNNLRQLDLGGNSLSGDIPSELGNLSNLESLALSYNPLSGGIPSTLGNLNSLRWLDLSGNSLSGDIPSELGDLANLLGLHLGGNSLSGSIPASLGNHLGNLRFLDLGGNSLSGSIPPSLGNLGNLEQLLLFNNHLTGSLPTTLIRLIHMDTLWLDNTQLCAPTDAAFQAWLSGIQNKTGVSNCP